uniref:Reverse transcriptase N-terminal domain-containing protein n=1 Tax=Pleonosporium borreri TaxID=2575635 RepID=A0A4D6WVX3_9FLOR|nr:hypothetical protein [Pleonosporium borreri]
MMMLWTNFPWNKIHTRILLIQKKIFQATKEYNKNKIYKLQKYLLNSNEVKLLSIDHIVKTIESYYSDNNITLINNQQKYLLYKLLFDAHLYSSNNLYFIIQQIRKYIIYLCIKPEWEAKLDFKFKQAFNFYTYIILQIKYINSKYIYNDFFIKDKQINYNLIDNTFIDISRIINKIQSFKYINTCIKYWLVNDFFINSITKQLSNNEYEIINKINYLSNSLCLLPNLLYQINILGYFWHLMYYKKIHNYLDNNRDSIIKYSILFNQNSSIINETVFYIKMQYVKNIKYKYSNTKHLLQRLINILKLYYSDYLSYINYIYINDIYSLYLLINIKIFYNIKKDKSLFRYNYFLYNINKNINTFIYTLKYMNYFKYN